MPNHARRLLATAVLTLPVMLAACDALRFSDPPAAPPSAEPPPAAPVSEPTPLRPVPLPARKPAPTPAPASVVAPPASEEPPLRPPVVIGLNRDALVQQFGMPASERQAPPARVLEFSSGDCRLAAYLYFDTARNDFYTLQYEVNGLAAPNAAVDQCLLRISRDASRR